MMGITEIFHSYLDPGSVSETYGTDCWIPTLSRAITGILPDKQTNKQTNKFIRLMVDKMTKSINFVCYIFCSSALCLSQYGTR